jgi:transposase
MAKPYSNDLRERVARSVLDGRSSRETARPFGVSVASAVKRSQRLRETGSAAARPMGGHRKRILAFEQAWMLERLAACPDLTVRALALELRERGYSSASPNTVWSLLRHAGFSFKKRCSPPSSCGPRSRDGASNGGSIRVGLIPGGSSSSMRRGPRPT